MPLAMREAELQRVLGPVPGLYSPIYLLTHPDLRCMPRIRIFFDFVVEEIERVRSLLTDGA
jgi:DNA-binding transcriptional LysR family regulator